MSADYLAGHADRDATAARIAGNYRHFIQQYLAADTAEVDALRTG